MQQNVNVKAEAKWTVLRASFINGTFLELKALLWVMAVLRLLEWIFT